jgi:glutathione-regulated potassium-efflux system protein KefB
MGFVLSPPPSSCRCWTSAARTRPRGPAGVSILLFEDLAIVPLLAVVAILAAVLGLAVESGAAAVATVGLAIGAIGARLPRRQMGLMNPVFRLLARYGGREVMTMRRPCWSWSGAAWLMNLGGLSMAMGAFLAGVLLSESTFRHQLEADVEPFRAILLGLFFLSVGMSLNLSPWCWPTGSVGPRWAWSPSWRSRTVAIYAVARIFKARNEREAVERAVLFAQGGEFAFVLYAAAAATGVFDARISGIATCPPSSSCRWP